MENMPTIIILVLSLTLSSCSMYPWELVGRDELCENGNLTNPELMYLIHSTLMNEFPDLVFLVHVADNSSSISSRIYQEDIYTGVISQVCSKSLFIYAAPSPVCKEKLQDGAAWVLTEAAVAYGQKAAVNSSSSVLEHTAAYTMESSKYIGILPDMVLVTEGYLIVHNFNTRCLYQRSLPVYNRGWIMLTVIGKSKQ